MTPRFIPHPLLRGGHRQTVLAAYLFRRRRYRAAQHHLRLDDGDTLVVHDDHAPHWQAGQRIVLLLHGLAGCHQSGYMQRVAAKLADAGCLALRLDMRGCGAGQHLAKHSVHAGRTQDLQETVQWIRRQWPNSPVTVIGFSLGASIVLKWLGTMAPAISPKVDSAIAVAPPIDLAHCCRNISRGLNRLYDRNFVRVLNRALTERKRLGAELVGAERPLIGRTLYDFDAEFTAPAGGFASVDEYYEQCSSMLTLPAIQVPTRILFAEDDPLVPGELFARATYSPTTQVYATRHGGHLGYLADRAARRPHDPDWHWLDWRMVDWVREFDR
ncbi:MAG: alpha/beta fold hydrolase [Planctomycetales bacterium]|nr:alpha/beta fold hydrolase [Planctomycetales bacterium]